MSRINLKGTVRMSMQNSSDVCRISLIEKNSRKQIIEIEIPQEEVFALFANLEAKCHYEIEDDLSMVGKNRVSDRIQVLIQNASDLYSKKNYRKICLKYMSENGMLDDGWFIYDSFNSQNTTVTINGLNYINATIAKYEEVK